MSQRVNYDEIAPQAVEALTGLNKYLDNISIVRGLRLLIEIRVSQINGCAFCVDLHTRQARQAGEDQRRLDNLPVWREAPFYSERERAALEWAESVTRVSDNNVPDTLFDRVRPHFTEKELVELTMIVITMNSWNRLAVSFRKGPRVAAGK